MSDVCEMRKGSIVFALSTFEQSFFSADRVESFYLITTSAGRIAGLCMCK